MKIVAKVRCPYCGKNCPLTRVLESRELPASYRELYTCCEDTDGCGLDFVVSIILHETVEVRKIEGEA